MAHGISHVVDYISPFLDQQSRASDDPRQQVTFTKEITKVIYQPSLPGASPCVLAFPEKGTIYSATTAAEVPGVVGPCSICKTNGASLRFRAQVLLAMRNNEDPSVAGGTRRWAPPRILIICSPLYISSRWVLPWTAAYRTSALWHLWHFAFIASDTFTPQLKGVALGSMSRVKRIGPPMTAIGVINHLEPTRFFTAMNAVHHNDFFCRSKDFVQCLRSQGNFPPVQTFIAGHISPPSLMLFPRCHAIPQNPLNPNPIISRGYACSESARCARSWKATDEGQLNRRPTSTSRIPWTCPCQMTTTIPGTPPKSAP